MRRIPTVWMLCVSLSASSLVACSPYVINSGPEPRSTVNGTTQCDVLVSHPSDPDRVTDGVSSSAVLHDEGIAACRAALANDPESLRLNYLLSRVLFYDDQTDEAIPYLETAADGGYRQAQFVLGYILAGGINDVQQDACRAEDLWAKSGRSGRLAALISYPQHVMRGRFDACEMQVSRDEQLEFLKEAKRRGLDFYQEMLVADLIDEHMTEGHMQE